MDKKSLENFKKILLAEKAKLEARLKEIADKDVYDSQYATKFPQYGEKEDENAQEAAEYATAISLEEEIEAGLADTKKALKRIEEGTYGNCVHCGQPIDIRRLEARPTSGSCVSCKKKLKGEM